MSRKQNKSIVMEFSQLILSYFIDIKGFSPHNIKQFLITMNEAIFIYIPY